MINHILGPQKFWEGIQKFLSKFQVWIIFLIKIFFGIFYSIFSSPLRALPIFGIALRVTWRKLGSVGSGRLGTRCWKFLKKIQKKKLFKNLPIWFSQKISGIFMFPGKVKKKMEWFFFKENPFLCLQKFLRILTNFSNWMLRVTGVFTGKKIFLFHFT